VVDTLRVADTTSAAAGPAAAAERYQDAADDEQDRRPDWHRARPKQGSPEQDGADDEQGCQREHHREQGCIGSGVCEHCPRGGRVGPDEAAHDECHQDVPRPECGDADAGQHRAGGREGGFPGADEPQDAGQCRQDEEGARRGGQATDHTDGLMGAQGGEVGRLGLVRVDGQQVSDDDPAPAQMPARPASRVRLGTGDGAVEGLGSVLLDDGVRWLVLMTNPSRSRCS